MEYKNINIRNLYIDLLNKIKNVEGVDKEYVDGLIQVIDYHLTALDTDLFAIESVIPDNASISNPLITAEDIPAQVNSDWNATSGVAQILNKPTIPAAQVNSDWNASSGPAEILNKPTIPAVHDPLYNTVTIESQYWGSGPLADGYYHQGVSLNNRFNLTAPPLVFCVPSNNTDLEAASGEKAAFALINVAKLDNYTPTSATYMELLAKNPPTIDITVGVSGTS